MKRKQIIRLLLPFFLCCLIPTLAVLSGAETTVEKKGSMVEIENNFAEYRLGDVKRIENDGYIGIPVQLSVYYDSEVPVTSGVGGTPIILYVINTNTERIGTKSDTEIIRSMLDRGYLVCVIDYLQNEKATTPALDWSLLGLRLELNTGTYFEGLGIPEKDYCETFVVPSGHDISLSHVYWEIDKHSVSGTLEYITEVWNKDFRSIFGEELILWTDADGNRKKVQAAYDGTAPVWLNANGEADENGSYIKIKHTLAEDVEDCVKPDGSPLDMNLYMNIIYPTEPKEAVPVMCFAGCNEHLPTAVAKAERPHFNGFLFSGYAGIMVDYGYVPMAREDHYKEFSGSNAAGVTGDNVTYSIAFYNGVKINTAAMRYIRYLAATNEAFAFDTESIGIYGLSKGGWMTMLGEEQPELLSERRFFEGHHGETRYEAGETAASASGLIDGGEAQPWLSYNGEALDSGADFIYASCGGGEEHITEGHAPTFVSCNIGDSYGSYYSTSNNFVNYCRNHDVPCLWLEVDKGHLFTYGEDMNYGVDSYDAFFTFANYYLRGDAVSVVYTSFTKKNTDVDPSADIVIKFSGAVSAESVKSIVLKSADGTAVSGTWSSQFGNTEWTLALSAPLASAAEYILTVPASLAGDNGIAMGKDTVFTFTTQEEGFAEVQLVSGAKGAYYSFAVDASMTDAKKVFLRFAVENSVQNLVKVYPVTAFNAENPDACEISESAIASVPVFGAGVYACDVTSYVNTLSVGETAAFLLKTERNVGISKVFSASMDEKIVGTIGKATVEIASDIAGVEGTGALKVTGFGTNTITGSKEKVVYYNNTSSIISIGGVVKNGALTKEDLGRRFTVSFRVYDTVSRKLSATLNGATSSAYGVADYNVARYNFMTKAGEWTEYSFEYVVREPLLGASGLLHKTLSISADTFGNLASDYPLYIDSVRVDEAVSEVTFGAAAVGYSATFVDLCETPYGRIPEEFEDVSKYPVAVFLKNGDSWKFRSAQASIPKSFSYGADTVIFLRNDSALTSGAYDLDTVGAGRSLTIDLGGHTLDITAAGQYSSLTTCAKQNGMRFTLKNGNVYSNGMASLTTIKSGADNTVFLNFEKLSVTLGEAFGEVNTLVRLAYHSPANYIATYNITVTDCDIDISRANNESLYAIRAGYIGNGYDLNWTVNGGSLIVGTSFYSKNLTVEKTGSLALGEGSDGQLFKVIATSDLSGKISYADLDGTKHYFGAVSTDGSAYEHTPMSLTTPYGDIPSDKLSPLSYPFIAFVDNGDGTYTYKTASANFFTDGGMEYSMRSVPNGIVFLRRDFTVTTTISNLSNNSNRLTLDLGGHVLTTGGSAAPIQSEAKHATQTKIVIKNGTVLLDKSALINSVSTTGKGKTFEYTLENITFRFASGTAVESPVTFGTASVAYNLSVAYENCTFDLTAYQSSAVNLIPADASGKVTLAIAVTGTTVKASSDLSGKISYTDPEGTKHYFGAVSTDGTTYTHIPMSLSTPYGDIPASKLSLLAYPFVAFEDNGDGTYTYKTASANFFTDGGMENTMRSVENGIILLRRDFTVTTKISNLSKRSNLTVDLGGHTLTTAGSTAPIESEAKSGNEVRITFENGTVLLDTTAFVNFSSYSVAETDYYITFKDIVFRFAEGTKVKSPTTFGLTRVSYFLSLCYEDCTFDLGNHQASGIVLIAANPKVNTQGAGTVTLRSVSVIGGTVKASSIEGIALSDVPSALTYGKSAGGKYLGFDVPIVQDAVLSGGIGLVNWGFGMSEYAPVGVTLSHEGVVVDEVFGYSFAPVTVKNGKNDAQKAVAAIRPGTMQMSLTLQSSIGLNLRISEILKDAVVTVDGKTFTLSESVNGTFLLQTTIAPNVANVPITITVKIGQNLHTFSTGIGAYAKQILSSASYSDVHNLTYAMVEYVRAMTGDQAFLGDVKAPDGYTVKTLVAKAPQNSGTYLTGIRFNLAGTIAIEIAGASAEGKDINIVLATGRSEHQTIKNGSVIFTDLYVNEFYGEMTIKVDKEVYKYSLENYLAAMDAQADKTVIQALYNYTYHADLYVISLTSR